MEPVVGDEPQGDEPQYEPPVLRRYGALTTVTQGSGGMNGDGMLGMTRGAMM